MKKLLYCAAALATMFFAGSCQRENFEPAGKGGAVTFTVTAPGELDTRATTIANGEKVNEVHWAVYKTNEAPNALNGTDGPLAQGIVPMANKKATLELDLLQDQEYTVLFWAQVAGKKHYTVGDLREVSVNYEVQQIDDKTVNTIAANDETRDAFFLRYDFSTETAQNYDVTLVRPFAQINLGTTLASLKPVQEGQTQGYEIGVKESEMTVKGIASSFSLVTGEGKNKAVDFTFTSTATPATAEEDLFVNDVKYHYVGMNYLVIPIEDKTVTVSYGITTDKGNITNTINNVPVKENYRTNIIGNLLTSKTDFEIVVDERFNKPDIKTDYVWGGETKAVTPVQENGVNVYYINDPAELAWVAEQVNTEVKGSVNNFKGEIVRLNADINLENHYWIPIGNGPQGNRYGRTFAGTFDGNGKTIRNMKVDYAHCAGLFGNVCGAVIDNVTIDGFNLKANHYAGAIIGWVEQGANDVIVNNCKALNGNIVVSVAKLSDGTFDYGDKAGAIVGYAHVGDYTNNKAQNVTITGYRDLGGVLGYAYNANVTDNTVSGVTLVQNLENNYKNYTVDQAANFVNDIIGRDAGNNTVNGNTGTVSKNEYVSEGLSKNVEVDETGAVIEETYYISEAAGFWTIADMINNPIQTRAASASEYNIELNTDIDLKNQEWTPIGSANQPHGFVGNFNGNNHTIKNLKIADIEPDADGYVYAGLFGVTEGTETERTCIKNLVIENVDIQVDGDIVAAAIAYPYYTDVENITVRGNIDIKGGHYTAGVLAYTRRCVYAKNLTIEGNEGSIIEGNQTIGGVISDIQMNGGLKANYSNFKASGLTIKATKNVGGISGIISEQTLNGAIVENVNIVCEKETKGIVSGALGGKSTITNVSYNNVTGATRVIGATYDTEHYVGQIIEVAGVKGIIYSIEDGIKVVSVEELNLNGKNWQNAMDWAAGLGEGWALATIDELDAIHAVRVALNDVLEADNPANALFEEGDDTEDRYLSSTKAEGIDPLGDEYFPNRVHMKLFNVRGYWDVPLSTVTTIHIYAPLKDFHFARAVYTL